MSEKVKNTIVVLEPSAKSAQELLAVLAEKDVAAIEKVSTPEQALQAIVTNLPCMLIASINDNAEVPARIQLFKRLETAIKHHGLKIYVVTPIKNRQLSDLITQKMGVTDYIVEPIPVRTMQFKANLQLKALDNFRRQQEIKKAAEEKVVIKKLDNGKKPEAAGTEVKTGSKPAVQAGEDTFLFKNNGVRKAGKKFTVELEGPDPSTGEWLQHEDKGDAQTAWRWVPNDEKEKQAQGAAPKDGWVHKGDKPHFNEETGKWAMTSEKPALSLMKDGRAVADKIGTDDAGEVFVAEDSPAAEENLQKNRLKAAAEKKKREDEKKSARELLGDDEKDDGKSETTLKAGEKKPEEAKTAGKSKLGMKGDKPSALRSLLGDDDDDEPSAGDLKDLRDPESGAAPTPLTDKRGASAATSLEEIVPGLEKGEESEPAADPRSPLAFLQKKKEAAARTSPSKISDGKEATERNDRTGEGGAKVGAGAPKDRRRKGQSGALDRLKSSLEDDLIDDEASEEETTIDSGEAAEAEGDEADGPRGPTLKAGAAGKAKRAEALRKDPAEKRGELRDNQAGGPKASREGIRKDRAQAAGRLQELLEAPLPDTLSAEEEEAVREELGLKNRPEIKPKDLIRKKRLKNVKELKDRLAELQAELDSPNEEEEGEALSAAVQPLDPEGAPVKRRGELTPDKLQGIRGAFDGEEAAAEHEEELRKRAKERAEERKRKAADKDRAEYVPEGELLPLGNAWESAGDHYVYLDAKVRYKGFARLEDLLPLWIFEGEDVPQLLDKTKQWRFLGGRPFQARSLAEVPASVRDFLIGLRDQLLKSSEGDKPEAEQDGALASLLEESEEDEESPGDEEAAGKAPAAKSGKSRAGKVRDLGKSLDELLGGDEAEEEASADESSEDPLADDEENEKSDERSAKASGDEDPDEKPAKASRDKDSEERSADALDEGDSEERDTDASGDESSAEATGKKKGKATDRMAELRAKLGMGDDADDDAETEAAEEEDPASEEPKEAGGSELGSLLAKNKSEGIQKFLERQKKKLEEGLPATNAASVSGAAAKKESTNGYLGIYVAISDAYAQVNSPETSLYRVLRALASSFKDCEAYLTALPDEAGTVRSRFGSVASSGAVKTLALEAGLSEPVRRGNGESAEILGYLFLKATGARAGFTEAETSTFRRLGPKVWPLVAQLDQPAERKAA